MTPPDGWSPAFPGQRPPFEPGHTASLQHGARSERRVAPLAEEIETAARADPTWPPHLRGREYAAAVRGWARAEAMAELLWRYLADRDLDEALTALETTDTETEQHKGRARSMSRSRRTTAALDAWQRAQTTAAYHRRQLGLDPVSRAKLGKDLAMAGAFAHAGIERLHAVGADLVEQARARGALTGPQTADPDPADQRQGDEREDGSREQ
ncbi:hypothetical protein [Pseudonocardia sp. 73-21]|uniref:hypothetical protein n=1 Tax=Pseudonocardia sp. 73-21 TaxID=1895809 RepID=UPI00095EC672|nr:hypothetical protein [Pseudonocardia sp. 73-21]OJY53533.1 MAG: hypothetical protein BGP03_17515 [Pseudonocardia sp. 73-21]